MKHNLDETATTDHLQFLIRQKWTILQAILIVMGVATVFLLRATPVYRASATLLARTNEPQMSTREDLPMVARALRLDEGRPVETQKRLVKSWPVISHALQRIGDKSPVEEAMKHVKVATFKDMDVIEVSVEDTSPRSAARLANEIARSYISFSQLAARESASTAKVFVKGQLNKVQNQLAAAEDRLRSFKQSHRITNLSEEVKADIVAISELKARAESAEADVTPARARVAKLDQLLSSQSERQKASVITERNPLIDSLAEEIAGLEAQQAGMLTEVTEANPSAKNIAARIATARQKLKAETDKVLRSEESQINPVHQSLLETLCTAKAESIVAEKRARNLRNVLRSREQSLNTLPDAELELARLERDVMTAERLFDTLTQKHEEFRLAEAIRLASARLVEPAVAPVQPVKPRKLLTLSFALMTGLLLGLATASLRDRLDDSVNSEEQVAAATGLPNLASVPDVGKELPCSMSWTSHSHAAEAYRILRTNLRFSAVDSEIKTLLVTSPLPGEGKSTVVLNLAAAVAAEGKKVLIVDADLRRPTIETKALIKSDMGLTELLVESRDVEEAVVPSNVKGLSIITSGQIPPNPSELLASKRMRQLLNDLSQRFDLIVIDSPPICPMADAAVLASIADATLLITSVGVSHRSAIEHALTLLTNARARVIGTVANRVRRKGSSYRNGYYYSHYYSGHNGHKQKKEEAASDTRSAA